MAENTSKKWQVKGFPEAVSQRNLARALGRKHATVGEWDWAPRNADKTYSIPDVFDAWKDKIMSEADAITEEAKDNDERWRKARADKLELEVLEKREELVPYEEIKQAVAVIAEHFKDVLLRIPGALAPELEGRTAIEVNARLEKAMRSALELLKQIPGAEPEEESA